MREKGSNEVSGGFLKDLTGRVKFRYLGLGFLWAWIYATWMTPAVFPKSAGLTVQNDISWLISCGTVVPALFLIPLLMKGRDVSSVPWFRRLGGIGTSIGAIMMAAEPLFGIELPAVAYLGGILTGVASALLWICWGEFSGKVDIEISEVAVPCCVAVPLVILFSTSFFSGVVGGLAICLLPLVSGILLEFSLEDEEALDPVPLMPKDERPPFMKDFIRMGIGSLAVYACISFVWGATSYPNVVGWGGTPVFPFLIGGVLAIIVSLLSIYFARSLNLFGLYRWLIPIILFSLLCLTIGRAWSSFLSYTLITVAQFGFDIIVWVYFTRIIRKGICPAGVAIGVNRGFVQAGVFAGSMCASWLSLPINDQVVSLTFICLVMACLFVTVVLSVLTQREKLEHAIDPAKVAQGGIDADQRIDLICEQLAKRYGLTDRERQILGYLAVGRSLPYIRDELVLSKNTVDTHAKNLYRKLGIHSRQELIDLFDEGSGR